MKTKLSTINLTKNVEKQYSLSITHSYFKLPLIYLIRGFQFLVIKYQKHHFESFRFILHSLPSLNYDYYSLKHTYRERYPGLFLDTHSILNHEYILKFIIKNQL